MHCISFKSLGNVQTYTLNASYLLRRKKTNVFAPQKKPHNEINMRLIFTYQHDQMDCGPACLKMIASYHGKNLAIGFLRDHAYLTREGVSMLGISQAANYIGLQALSAKLTLEKLLEQAAFPCIIHWNQNHFVVLEKVKTNFFTKKRRYKIADPAHGKIVLSETDFLNGWLADGKSGIALFLAPTPLFEDMKEVVEPTVSLKFVLAYLLPFKRQLIHMTLLLFIGSSLTLIFPFLTQALIDRGVNGKNLDLISLILLAQLMLFFGTITIEILRNRIMLFIGTRISISIISDFLKKILQLPIQFFDTKMMGDFSQRINDNERIEEFLTSQSLITFFSVVTFSVFFGVLWYYDFTILAVYLSLTVVSLGWSFYWMKKRKLLDYQRFQLDSQNQDSIYEIINGVSEMKLNQFEDFKRMEWEEIQEKLFQINLRVLKLDQLQLSGFEFFNQIKNIVVTFLAATFVVVGKMTLGELLSVSYIVGQMNAPVSQLVTFIRSFQDAKLSLERLNEVQHHASEEKSNQNALQLSEKDDSNAGIQLNNVSFQFGGPLSPFVLKNIDLHIPAGKVTAIVGASGSGKTTLMKLLLRYYTPTEGTISFNEHPIAEISPRSLREKCGVVLQDGFIFSDSIFRNIITGDENPQLEKFENAISIANIQDFIDALPLGVHTKIGASGNGISGGQRQRVLIARAVYKQPHYLFFDEATSALDAENEKIIHDKLQLFFQGRTVLIIAHRLSTVKNADQIVVLKNGTIVECGTHNTLVEQKKEYYNLVKNQLELGGIEA